MHWMHGALRSLQSHHLGFFPSFTDDDQTNGVASEVVTPQRGHSPWRQGRAKLVVLEERSGRFEDMQTFFCLLPRARTRSIPEPQSWAHRGLMATSLDVLGGGTNGRRVRCSYDKQRLKFGRSCKMKQKSRNKHGPTKMCNNSIGEIGLDGGCQLLFVNSAATAHQQLCRCNALKTKLFKHCLIFERPCPNQHPCCRHVA